MEKDIESGKIIISLDDLKNDDIRFLKKYIQESDIKYSIEFPNTFIKIFLNFILFGSLIAFLVMVSSVIAEYLHIAYGTLFFPIYISIYPIVIILLVKIVEIKWLNDSLFQSHKLMLIGVILISNYILFYNDIPFGVEKIVFALLIPIIYICTFVYLVDTIFSDFKLKKKIIGKNNIILAVSILFVYIVFDFQSSILSFIISFFDHHPRLVTIISFFDHHPWLAGSIIGSFSLLVAVYGFLISRKGKESTIK